MIYLDNNATTAEHPKCVKARRDFEKCFANPSSASAEANKAKREIEKSRQLVKKALGMKEKDYLAFTSGASESNATILGSVVDSYWEKHGKAPHIVSTKVEHKSVLEKLKALDRAKRATFTLLDVDREGRVHDVADAVRKNTVLVSVIGANNELGTLNNLKKIIREVRAKNKSVHIHVDAVQLMGKFPERVMLGDSAAVSFHKIHGPKGLGALLIKNAEDPCKRFVAQICGTQESGFRGGTENVGAIVAAKYAVSAACRGRKKKNERLFSMCRSFLKNLDAFLMYAEDFPDWETVLDHVSHLRRCVVLGPKNQSERSPHTLLVSFLPPEGAKEMCNVKFRRDLDKQGVIVSVASACLSSDDKASHVLSAVHAPKEIKRGVIRVSFSDHTSTKDVHDATKIINGVLNGNKK